MAREVVWSENRPGMIYQLRPTTLHRILRAMRHHLFTR